MVDIEDLKSSAQGGRVGSNPTSDTISLRDSSKEKVSPYFEVGWNLYFYDEK